jgi:NAD(P)-dependent dehydrogenase (short-subunit alcohol dehydrogenase family)
VSKPAEVDRAFARLVETFGRLDVLFNNAGISAKAAPIDEIPVEDWLELSSVNITGMFLCARAAFGQMRVQDPQGGRIINNGSISAHVPRPGSVPYTMSKHAVTGLTRTLGLDGRAFNIACGQIDIGNALTQMAARFQTGVPQADGQIKVEPVMDVAHVADAVLQMARLPLGVNVPFMTLMARDMPYIGRG